MDWGYHMGSCNRGSRFGNQKIFKKQKIKIPNNAIPLANAKYLHIITTILFNW